MRRWSDLKVQFKFWFFTFICLQIGLLVHYYDFYLHQYWFPNMPHVMKLNVLNQTYIRCILGNQYWSYLGILERNHPKKCFKIPFWEFLLYFLHSTLFSVFCMMIHCLWAFNQTVNYSIQILSITLTWMIKCLCESY